MRRGIVPVLGFALAAFATSPARGFEMDTIETSSGTLEITFVGHASLMFAFDGKTIHVDPWGKLADYSALPKADLILITHGHQDHLDLAAIETLRKDGTQVVTNAASGSAVPGAAAMANGDTTTVLGVKIEAIPAYNIVGMRAPGQPFHPQGEGNGYVLTFGGRRVYVAGDTENTPEMKALRGIHCAFLPMNLPYTMTPEMVADAARAMNPDILYPYHFGETDPARLAELLKDTGIEVRVRRMP